MQHNKGCCLYRILYFIKYSMYICSVVNVFAVHFIAYIRTALAMALIRSKPPDLSVISYATNICGMAIFICVQFDHIFFWHFAFIVSHIEALIAGKFNKAQLRLKTKLDRSRQELLTLQQQLVMEQARSLNTSPAHTSNEVGLAAFFVHESVLWHLLMCSLIAWIFR